MPYRMSRQDTATSDGMQRRKNDWLPIGAGECGRLSAACLDLVWSVLIWSGLVWLATSHVGLAASVAGLQANFFLGLLSGHLFFVAVF